MRITSIYFTINHKIMSIKAIIRKDSESEITQSCPTLCNPMECSLPGSSIHGIFQTRVLKWVAIFFSRGSSQHSDWIWVSHIAGRCFTIWPKRETTWKIRADYEKTKAMLKTDTLLSLLENLNLKCCFVSSRFLSAFPCPIRTKILKQRSLMLCYMGRIKSCVTEPCSKT